MERVHGGPSSPLLDQHALNVLGRVDDGIGGSGHEHRHHEQGHTEPGVGAHARDRHARGQRDRPHRVGAQGAEPADDAAGERRRQQRPGREGDHDEPELAVAQREGGLDLGVARQERGEQDAVGEEHQ
ncbi:hypothetical protein V6S66_04305 [Aeromicrobium sp. Sec7.5]